MFYCEECRKKNDWPESMVRSYGPCGMCKKEAHCYDVPSKYLPTRISPEEMDEINATLHKHGYPSLDDEAGWRERKRKQDNRRDYERTIGIEVPLHFFVLEFALPIAVMVIVHAVVG